MYHSEEETYCFRLWQTFHQSISPNRSIWLPLPPFTENMLEILPKIDYKKHGCLQSMDLEIFYQDLAGHTLFQKRKLVDYSSKRNAFLSSKST